jgi:hypothetical protein
MQAKVSAGPADVLPVTDVEYDFCPHADSAKAPASNIR